MYSKKEVLVITTATPSEGKIIKHLQPVTTHVVAGTNLFSDFFAGMSDIFGGRSGSYQKQLSSIYSEAIERIKQEAKRIGANGVVGLKIDIDEISGQGKSMFMITAIGTAVLIESERKPNFSNETLGDSHDRVTNEAVMRLKSLKILLQKAQNDKLKYTRETWDFILQNKVAEMYQPVMQKLVGLLENPSSYPQETIDAFKENTENFLRSLEIEDQKKLTYSTLKEADIKRSAESFLLDYIKKELLLDFEEVLKMLDEENIKVQKRGLLISTFDLPYYTPDEELGYKNLLEKIAQTFKHRGKKTTKKQLLSSKEKEAWECECGKINDIEYTHCSKCQKDIKGFNAIELTPEGAIKKIYEKRNLIRESLEQP